MAKLASSRLWTGLAGIRVCHREEASQVMQMAAIPHGNTRTMGSVQPRESDHFSIARSRSKKRMRVPERVRYVCMQIARPPAPVRLVFMGSSIFSPH